MKIIVDAYGGDNAPLEVLRGCAAAVEAYGYEIILCGLEKSLRKLALEYDIPLKNFTFVEAPDVISMEDDPGSILKKKKNCSMAVGLRLLGEGGGDAFVSGGSTGALVVGGTFYVKRIKGIKRCALATLMPSTKDYFMLLDVGANVDCRPEMLRQFGIMGSVYMESVMGRAEPKVGLVNIGTETTKGGELQLNSFELLQQAPVNFIGNVEAREIPYGDCDVLVCDGFTGNIILKLTEGLASSLLGQIKDILKSNMRGKLAAAMVMPGMKELKKRMSTEEVGGAPLLGTLRPVFKAHGNSNAKAFQNAIRVAADFASKGVIDRITESLAERSKEEKEIEE